MKEYIGQEIVVMTNGQSVKGVLVADDKQFMTIQTADVVAKFPKARINGFMVPSTAAIMGGAKASGFIVLACKNEKMKCSGVKYVKSGDGASKNDFAAFMSDCGKCDSSCSKMNLGDLVKILYSGKADFLDGFIFGEYPEG